MHSPRGCFGKKIYLCPRLKQPGPWTERHYAKKPPRPSTPSSARGSIPVSRATLYNTLNLLAEAGLVCVHHFEDCPTLYEFTYGTAGRNHLLCTGCGRILPFED